MGWACPRVGLWARAGTQPREPTQGFHFTRQRRGVVSPSCPLRLAGGVGVLAQPQPRCSPCPPRPTRAGEAVRAFRTVLALPCSLAALLRAALGLQARAQLGGCCQVTLRDRCHPTPPSATCGSGGGTHLGHPLSRTSQERSPGAAGMGTGSEPQGQEGPKAGGDHAQGAGAGAGLGFPWGGKGRRDALQRKVLDPQPSTPSHWLRSKELYLKINLCTCVGRGRSHSPGGDRTPHSAWGNSRVGRGAASSQGWGRKTVPAPSSRLAAPLPLPTLPPQPLPRTLIPYSTQLQRGATRPPQCPPSPAVPQPGQSTCRGAGRTEEDQGAAAETVSQSPGGCSMPEDVAAPTECHGAHGEEPTLLPPRWGRGSQDPDEAAQGLRHLHTDGRDRVLEEQVQSWKGAEHTHAGGCRATATIRLCSITKEEGAPLQGPSASPAAGPP